MRYSLWARRMNKLQAYSFKYHMQGHVIRSLLEILVCVVANILQLPSIPPIVYRKVCVQSTIAKIEQPHLVEFINRLVFSVDFSAWFQGLSSFAHNLVSLECRNNNQTLVSNFWDWLCIFNRLVWIGHMNSFLTFYSIRGHTFFHFFLKKGNRLIIF